MSELYGQSADRINDKTRERIADLQRASGEVWLGQINLYTDPERERILWRWDGGMVFNFSATFAIPAYDPTLEQMIRERATTDSSPKEDYRRVWLIFLRVEELGGFPLLWA